jgi:predicted Rdx family selenoprotein
MVLIHYCSTCGFRKPAERIAAAVTQSLSLRCELRKAFWGTFRIEYDGREIYNRWKSGGWLGRLGLGKNPRPEEIVELLRRSELPASESEPQANVSTAASS